MVTDKLEQIKNRWIEIQEQLSDPEIVSDQKRYQRMMKEYKDMGNVVEVYDQYQLVLANIDSNKAILQTEKDEEFRDMAKQDLDELATKKDELEEEIRLLLI